mmetsp:Transcript_21737/g.43755  ORF Transcript_21737/g.43755 Transcript_21737/m.43755 type:complete len:550 (-) Transcript_21737:312-1961(-)
MQSQFFVSVAILVIQHSYATSPQHIVLHAWPGGLSHGLNAAAIARRLASDHEVVTLLAAECDVSVLTPLAGPDVHIVPFRVQLKETATTVGLPHLGDLTQETVEGIVTRMTALDPLEGIKVAANWILEGCEWLLNDERAKHVLSSATLLVTDIDSGCAISILQIYGMDAIGYGTGGTANTMPGVWTGTAYDPALTSKLSGLDMGLLSATWNVFASLLASTAFEVIAAKFCSLAATIRNSTVPLGSGSCLGSLWQKLSVVLITTTVATDIPRMMPPSFVHVGSLLARPAQPLPPGSLHDFVADADNGFVLVSFGTMASLASDTHVLSKLAEAFGSIAPIRIIWKLKISGRTQTVMPDNVLVSSWVPQNDLLGHPKCLALLTHGGRNSIEEAAFHAVPLVGVPLFGDHFDNIAKARHRGFAVSLHRRDLTDAPAVARALRVVMAADMKHNAQTLSRAIRAHRTSPLDHVAAHVQYNIDSGGATFATPLWVEEGKGYWDLLLPHLVLWGCVLVVLVCGSALSMLIARTLSRALSRTWTRSARQAVRASTKGD